MITKADAPTEEILRDFVAAVRKWRKAKRKRPLTFRTGDLHVLSTVLGTDPDEIELRLIAMTGCSQAEARVLRKWFLAAVVTIPLAMTTVGGIDPAAASAASPHSPSAMTHHRAASPSASFASTKHRPSATRKHRQSATRKHRQSATKKHRQSATKKLSPVGIPGAWNVVLDSGFSGPSLDTSIWQPGWFGSGTTGPVNPLEAACYSSNNVTFPGDGSVHLKVTASRSTCKGMTKPYTGALLSSNPHDGRASGGFEFTYGVVEARVHIPASGRLVANWPAIWTDGQSWPATGEGDIMEGLGGQACFHFHSTAGGPGTCVAINAAVIARLVEAALDWLKERRDRPGGDPEPA